MASLKEYLREYGKQASRLSFSQGTDKAIVLSSSNTQFVDFIPPSDGWLLVRAKGKNISAEILHDEIFGVVSSKYDGFWGSCILPVKKGVSVGHAVFGTEIQDYWVRFIPTKASS